jgi:hypothetical protein
VRALPLLLLLAACALSARPLSADTASSIRSLDDCLVRLAPAAPQVLNLADPVQVPEVPQRADVPDVPAVLQPPGVFKVPHAPRAPAGVDALRAACPDLEQTIIESGLLGELPEHWQDKLDRRGIADLSALMRRYASPPLRAEPGAPALQEIVRGMNQPQPRASWWQDFKQWLRRVLLPPMNSNPAWLSGWLSRVSLSPRLLRSLLYAMLGAVTVMAWWLVRRELRAAGVGAAAARRAAALWPRSPLPAADESLSLDDVERAPLRERAALLLRLLVRALSQSGRLKNERGLTHRELGVRSGFDDPEQRSRFVRLSLLAERLLYGPAAAAGGAEAQPQIDRALSDGRQLYAQLLGSRGGAR